MPVWAHERPVAALRWVVDVSQAGRLRVAWAVMRMAGHDRTAAKRTQDQHSSQPKCSAEARWYRVPAPQKFLQELLDKTIRLHFLRVESASAEGLLDGYDGMGVVVRRAGRLTFYPWHVLRSIEAAEED